MENIRDIKKCLKREDFPRLSELTGYSQDYIISCLNYRRNNRLIVLAAQQIIAGRRVSC
ncbi:MAG: hypothetical protein ACLFUB_01490 [Cyclobacteriaceae bacterium]